MFAGERSRHAVVLGGIVLAHAIVIAGLLSIGPRIAENVSATPVAVRFVPVRAHPREWSPPDVKVVRVDSIAPMPDLPLIEIPVAPPSQAAISVAAQSAPVPEAAESSAPRLISTVEYLREPDPRYPPQSRRLREQGLVVLRVLIDERGTAHSIEIETSSGFERLDQAAREAVKRAAFRPYVEDGSPRRAFVLIPIEFSLNRRAA